ncbi:MAG: histidine kinase [Opitutae bacterium]|nr:histidine kinase [Opitutae bacterium]
MILGPSDLPLTIEVRFSQAALIDLVALMPATYTDNQDQLRALGFPKRFILERILEDGTTEIIADYRQTDHPEPGTEPQLFACPAPKPTIGLRLTTTALHGNPTWWTGEHIMALSEIFAFSKNWNVALNAEVQAPLMLVDHGRIWAPECLTDGFTMFSNIRRSLNNPYIWDFHSGAESFDLTYDLGEEEAEVDELRIWPVMFYAQQTYPLGNGVNFPSRIRVERLAHPADKRGIVVLDNQARFPAPGSSPLMLRLPTSKGRYFRIILSDENPEHSTERKRSISTFDEQLSLSEIELFGKGTRLTGMRIATLKKPELPAREKHSKGRDNPRRLTDGNTREGNILPLRQWLIDFNRRAGLERKLNTLQLDLELARRQERERLVFLVLSATGLVLFLAMMVWLVRLLAERRWNRVREMIAADLHDEVGANASCIAHTTELVLETLREPTVKQSKLLADVIRTARTTEDETRRLVRFIEQRETQGDIAVHFRETAQLILVGISHSFDFDQQRPFNQLNPARKWELLLFFKEALNNIRKHANATSVEIVTRRKNGSTELIVTDNGCGIPEDRLPARHLEIRAARLHGKLNINTSTSGTRVSLTLKKK